MKFIIQFVFTFILAFILTQFLPFWSVALAGFIVGLFIKTNTVSSFLGGFVSIFLLWGVSAWVISSGNNHILLERIAEVFTLSPVLLLLVTSLIGGILGGFSAASGTQLRWLLSPRRKRPNPYHGL